MNQPEVDPIGARQVEALASVSTATLTAVLLKKGLRNVWMRRARPLIPGYEAWKKERG